MLLGRLPYRFGPPICKDFGDEQRIAADRGPCHRDPQVPQAARGCQGRPEVHFPRRTDQSCRNSDRALALEDCQTVTTIFCDSLSPFCCIIQ